MNLEWLLFLALLACAGLPFLRRWLAATLMVSAAVAVAATKWHHRQSALDQRTLQHLRSIPREGRPGGFVTSDTCQTCHPQAHATWHQSYHRTMTQYATPGTVRGDFDGVMLELAGESYRLDQRGDEFWIEMPDPDAKLQQSTARPGAMPVQSPVSQVRRRVTLLTGSHHMQTCWVPSRDGNMQLSVPFTYLFEADRWVPRNATFLMDPESPVAVQLWNASCIQCHATAGQPRPDRNNWFRNDTRMAEKGIACEACHGPAEQHVRMHQNPLTRYAHRHDPNANLAIINPAKLDHRASSQVCGQCHSIKHLAPGHPWRHEGFQYRPGEDLDREAPIVRPVHHATEAWFRDLLRRDPTFVVDRYWSDGMVRVSGREYNGLVETPCFQRGTMSCLSCHSAHQSDPDDQLAAGMRTNAACASCHSGFDSPDHTHHPAGSSGSLCYNCHMPHTTYGLLKAIRSHTIDSPTAQASVQTGRPNACNLCHLDQTLAWTAQHLRDWYGQPTPALSRDHEQISAAALWTLRGDAGQRALMAWHLGWEPARAVASENSLAPYLAHLLEDPYATVRYIAGRSLRQLPDFADFEYDFIADPTAWTAARQRALQIQETRTPTSPQPAIDLDRETWQRVLSERDDRPVNLLE